MSIARCQFCDTLYDQDYYVEHEEECACEYYQTDEIEQCDNCYKWKEDKNMNDYIIRGNTYRYCDDCYEPIIVNAINEKEAL